MTSLFPLMIGARISGAWDDFFRLGLFSSSKVCSNGKKLKLNFGLIIL